MLRRSTCDGTYAIGEEGGDHAAPHTCIGDSGQRIAHLCFSLHINLETIKVKENFVRRIAARELTKEDAGIVLEDIVAERLLFPVAESNPVFPRAAEVDDETEDDESASRGQRAGIGIGLEGPGDAPS